MGIFGNRNTGGVLGAAAISGLSEYLRQKAKNDLLKAKAEAKAEAAAAEKADEDAKWWLKFNQDQEPIENAKLDDFRSVMDGVTPMNREDKYLQLRLLAGKDEDLLRMADRFGEQYGIVPPKMPAAQGPADGAEASALGDAVPGRAATAASKVIRGGIFGISTKTGDSSESRVADVSGGPLSFLDRVRKSGYSDPQAWADGGGQAEVQNVYTSAMAAVLTRGGRPFFEAMRNPDAFQTAKLAGETVIAEQYPGLPTKVRTAISDYWDKQQDDLLSDDTTRRALAEANIRLATSRDKVLGEKVTMAQNIIIKTLAQPNAQQAMMAAMAAGGSFAEAFGKDPAAETAVATQRKALEILTNDPSIDPAYAAKAALDEFAGHPGLQSPYGARGYDTVEEIVDGQTVSRKVLRDLPYGFPSDTPQEILDLIKRVGPAGVIPAGYDPITHELRVAIPFNAAGQDTAQTYITVDREGAKKWSADLDKIEAAKQGNVSSGLPELDEKVKEAFKESAPLVEEAKKQGDSFLKKAKGAVIGIPAAMGRGFGAGGGAVGSAAGGLSREAASFASSLFGDGDTLAEGDQGSAKFNVFDPNEPFRDKTMRDYLRNTYPQSAYIFDGQIGGRR